MISIDPFSLNPLPLSVVCKGFHLSQMELSSKAVSVPGVFLRQYISVGILYTTFEHRSDECIFVYKCVSVHSTLSSSISTTELECISRGGSYGLPH